jgi:hypothetical protein
MQIKTIAPDLVFIIEEKWHPMFTPDVNSLVVTPGAPGNTG